MRKYLIVIMILMGICFNISCKDKGTTIINNVINQEVDVEDDIKLSNIEDVLVNTCEVVSNQVVGICAKSSQALINNPSYASGVVIAKKNNTYYIVTNRHVICKSKSVIYDDIKVYIGHLNIYFEANLVSYDVNTDLALLKIETPVLLSVAKLGDSDNIKIGKYAICVGYPYEMEKYHNTVTIGHISYVERIIEENNLNDELVESKYIQHDAAINIGSSGGGLFNLNGELVGINTFKIVGNSNIDGMSFSVPVNVLKEIFNSYLN